MARLLATLAISLLAFTASAHAQFDHQHKAWGELLKKHVVLIDGGNASQVRYAAMARDRVTLRAYTIRAKGVYDEPRIHMAVNCASIGCPMLREEPFVADKLDRQLEEQVVRFLSDRSRNRYNAASNRLEVSTIFKWYGVDFTSGLKGIESREQFFARYAAHLSDKPDQQKAVAEGKPAIAYLEYDWSLNDAKQ